MTAHPGVSMTGFGRGTAIAGTAHVTVELRAVNHRFLDIRIRGASPSQDDLVTGRLRERLSRGAITATVAVDSGGAPTSTIDPSAAAAAHRALAAIAAELGLAAPSLADVLAVPGVIRATAVADDLDPAVAAATAAAIDALCVARAREGQALVADLTARVAALRTLLVELSAATAAAGPALAARLRERLDRLLAPGAVDPDRLAAEVAILVDRADTSEELVRFATHLDALAATLAEAGPIGRRLDFLLQELGREINTTGAKSPDRAISSLVVQAKAELEKMREQVQNLE